MRIVSLFVVLAVIMFGSGCNRTEPPNTPAMTVTTTATAPVAEPPETKILAHVREGMTRAQVEETIDALRPGEDWDDSWTLGHPTAYGRYPLGNGVCLILTYGEVSDPNGNIQAKDKVSAVEIVRFDDLKNQVPEGLFPYVRLIHLSPSVNGQKFDPLPLIRAVNGLQPLDQEKALRALREYVKLATSDPNQEWRYDMDEQRVFLIARTLFVRKDGNPQMPWLIIGATGPDVHPEDKNWPLFPLVMQDDIPFDLSGGYMLGGEPESPTQHLDYCEAHCRLRDGPLRPNVSPVLAVEKLYGSQRWRALFPKGEDGDWTKSLLRCQALRPLQPLLGTSPDFRQINPYCVHPAQADRTWQEDLKDQRLREAKWDAATQSFH